MVLESFGLYSTLSVPHCNTVTVYTVVILGINPSRLTRLRYHHSVSTLVIVVRRYIACWIEEGLNFVLDQKNVIHYSAHAVSRPRKYFVVLLKLNGHQYENLDKCILCEMIKSTTLKKIQPTLNTSAYAKMEKLPKLHFTHLFENLFK